PELPVQYADYAVWQRDWLRGETLATQLGWWKQLLAGAPHALELSTDKPRPAVLSHQGAAVHVHLPVGLSQSLDALAQREGATPFMVLLAAFQALLQRHSGQEDVLVGSPIAGRRHAETEGLIGFFVNTLVLRARFAPALTFRQLLAQVRHTTLGAYEHQDVPFEKLVEELQPARDLSRTPLFQAMFALQNTPSSEISLPGLTLSGIEAESSAARFELNLELTRTSAGYRGAIIFSTELFEHSTAERLTSHFQLLLSGALSSPDAPLSDLPLLTAEERNRVVVEWNRTGTDFASDACLHTRFEQQARRTPDAPAVQLGDSMLTYARLNARANQLAHHLRKLGVGPEVRVGLCLERSPEAIVALLAVLKAGGAYVPIDPAAPAQRKSYFLQDSGAPVLLTAQHLADAWKPEVRHLVCLDTEASRLSALPETDMPSSATADHLAYVIYTSGSTGTPKGVMVRHRSLLNLHQGLRQSFYADMPPGSRLSLNAPLYFDASLQQVVQLIDGHCLFIVPEDARKDPRALKQWLVHHRIDAFDSTPSLLKAVMEAGLLQGEWVPRWLLPGGEAIDEGMWRELATSPRARTFNVYGPTESTVESTVAAVLPGTSPSIGRPLANTQAYVLDERMQLAPPGVPGELYLAGEGLARGYLGRPALTAERFVPNPFATEPGARMYRTGDKARWRQDGTLEYLGRLDFQVKVRGFRIELGEIENVLRAHPAVKDAVVLAREDVPGDKRLVAYVVATDSTADLRAHAQQHLPEYMVPSAFVALPALPLNANGKVDRKALPAPDASAVRHNQYVAPSTPTETTLAEVFAQVLGVERVGAQDHFFELGGHSLLATRVVARIRAALGVELSVRAFFEAPTVAALAEHLQTATSRSSLPPLTRVRGEDRVPMSFAQQRLWFLDQLQPGQALYNMSSALRLSGTLEPGAFQHAIDELVRRHESLRTTFHAEGGEPFQLIHPATRGQLQVVDLSALPEEQRQSEAMRIAIEDARQPFDLSRGPLLRTTLLKLEPTEHVLLLCMHHSISDGWSMGVLVREVTSLYEAFRHGRSSPLPELPVQYADYSVWQRDWLRGATLQAQIGWWKQLLSGAPAALELPTDKSRPATLTYAGATVPVHLPERLSQSLEALAQREGVTPYMLLLAAFQTVLHRYSGQEDVLVGSPIAGRRHSETEGLIGFFVNTLVLRARFTPSLSFRQLLTQVRDTTLGAYEHQDVPFEKLVEELQPVRDLGRTPLFQVLFVLQNTPDAGLSLPELKLRAVDVEQTVSRFELELGLTRSQDGYRGGLTFSTELFEHSTAERLMAHLQLLLEGALASPDAPVAALPMQTAAERHQVLVE
ncbi:amino acid adenylation domain-containing protein, partial [Pyxidicoccus sp. 3LG]